MDEEVGPLADQSRYGALMDEEDGVQAETLRENFFAAKESSPDQKAQAVQLSNKTQIPVSVVEGDFDRVKKEEHLRSIDYRKLNTQYPSLSRWLGDINNATLAQDEIESLKAIEDQIQDHSMLETLTNSFGSGLTQAASSLTKVPAFAADTFTQYQNLKSKGFNVIAEATGSDARREMIKTPDALLDNELVKGYEDKAKAMRAIVPELSESVWDNISSGNYARAGRTALAQAVHSSPNLMVMLALGRQNLQREALLYAGITTAADSAAENKENKNLSPEMGFANASLKGGAEAVFEKIGTFLPLKAWETAITNSAGKAVTKEVFKDLFKTLLYTTGINFTEEALTSGTQDLTDYYTGANPDALKGIEKRMFDAGSVGAVAGGGIVSPGAAAMAFERQAQVRRTEKAKEFYTALGPTLEATKLRERLPEAQQKLVEQITAGTPVENIYISAEAVDKYFQGPKGNPVKAMSDLGVLEEYEQAKESGTDIKIPLAKWTNQVVGTEHYAGLANDIRFSVEDFSVNEQAEIERQVKEQIKAQEAESEAQEEVTKDQSANKVRDIVAAQLEEAGADPKQAILYGAAFKTLGERIGMDPLELYEQFKLRIGGGDLNAQGLVLNQDDDFKAFRDEEIARVDQQFKDPELKAQYLSRPETMGGKRLDSDIARELLSEYAKDREGRMVYSEITDRAVGMMMKEIYEEKLKEEPSGDVWLMAGGPGSGKSEVFNRLGESLSDAEIIYDSVSSNIEIAKSRVQQALDSGRSVDIKFVYTPLEQALEWVEKRFKKDGRPVDTEWAVKAHINAIETIIALAEEYSAHPDVEIQIYDNSRNVREDSLTIEDLRALRYIEEGETVDQATERLLPEARERLQNVERETNQARRTAAEGFKARRNAQASGSESGAQHSGIQEGPGGESQGDVARGPRKLNQSAVGAMAPQLTPLGFFSQIEHEVSKMDFKSIPAKDLLGRIKNTSGIKKEELEWLSLEEWLQATDEAKGTESHDVIVKDSAGEVVDQTTHPTFTEAEVRATELKAQGDNPIIESTNRTGKVTKDEVLQFIKNNGVKVEQVILGSSAGNSEGPFDWSDLEFVKLSEHDRDQYHRGVDEEVENSFQNDEEWLNEERALVRPKFVADYTDAEGQIDEEGLSEKVDDYLREVVFLDRAEEYVDSEEFYNAVYVITERNSGYTLEGSDESGYWYSPEARKSFDGNAEEAKIELASWLIENEGIEATTKDFLTADKIEWRQPESKKDKSSTTRKVNQLIRENRIRYEQESRERFKSQYKDDVSKKQQKKYLAEDVKMFAQEEADEFFKDPKNAKNVISVRLNNPGFEAELLGNEVKGFTLTFESPTIKNNRYDSGPMSLEEAKAWAVSKLVEAETISPARKKKNEDDPNEVSGPTNWQKYKVSGGENYREILLTLPNQKGEAFKYDTHFRGQKNFVAHARITDRVDGEGRKTLFIEEIQSDWHQQGREKGYKGQKFSEVDLPADVKVVEPDEGADHKFVVAGEDGMLDLNTQANTRDEAANLYLQKRADTVPDAPFKNTDAWAALVLKRLMRMAVEQGYDAIAWTPAEVHVERWGTDSVSWVKREGADTSSWKIQKTKDGSFAVLKPRESALKTHSPEEMMGDFATEENAQKFINERSQAHFLVGSVEQRGGNADGTNIEELARMRGELLERRGERVTTREELTKVVAETLGRERNDRSLDSLTERIWKQMQAEDQHTGAVEPRKEGMEFFYNKLIPDTAKKLLKKLDPEAKIEVGQINESHVETIPESEDGKPDIKKFGMKVLEIPLTPKLKEEIAKGFALFQGGDDPRGQIQIGDQGINISLLPKADLSTFIHETGHFYLEVLGDVAKREATPQGVKDDYSAVLNWLGAKDGEKLSVEQHEMFARGFEAYLMEGKAPTQSLRAAFAKFRVWLISVYRQLVNLNVQLTDEVRGVMDRLLATDEEIAQAQSLQNMQPLFKDPTAFGMTGEKAQRYIIAREEARQAAEEEITQKLVSDFMKAKESWWVKQHGEIQSEIESEMNQQKIYRALSILQRGKLPDNSPLPDGMPEVKLSKEVLMIMFGKEITKKLPRPYVYKAKGGLHPDVAAELLGFESGDDLVTQLINTPKKEIAAKAAADQRMAELHPDLLFNGQLPEESMKAVHNEKRAYVLRLELEHLASNDMPALKDAIRKVARRVPTDKIVREQATRIVGSKRVGELSPVLFQRAEAKAAKEAGEALAKGDFDLAFELKQRELLNHELYRATVTAKEDIEKSIESFKKIAKVDEKLSKTRDIDLVNAARAVLASYGLGRSEESVETYLAPIKAYDPEAYQTIAALVESVTTTAGAYKTVSYDNFVAMKDAVNALWDLAKSTRQIEIDGVTMDRDSIVDELKISLDNMNAPERIAGYKRAVSDFDKVVMTILGAKARLRRVESWVDAIDMGDINGPFRRYIWNPVAEAAGRYREAKKGVIEKYLSIVKAIEPSLSQEDIKAPEIGYTFKGKQELLGALLHTGNESNLSKLLRGRKWGEFDDNGNLDSSNWDNFLRRMHQEGIITKADWDFVQGVWDLLEEQKPGAQKAHKKMYGYYFNEITASEFLTPFGMYRGGYVPAIADPFIAEDAQIREEKAIIEGLNNSFMFPTTGRGFTKKRVEMYARPLTLDLKFIPSHIDKVMRFVHIESHVKEVGRIVMDRSFRGSLDQVDPAAGGGMLVPWLQRAALQKVETPSEGKDGRGFDTFWRQLRTRTGLQVMAGNVTNAMQQFTGFSIAAVKVSPKHLAHGLWTYMKAPSKTAEAVAEQSTMMRNRLSTATIEMQNQIDEMLLNPTKYEQAREFAKANGYFLQSGAQSVVDTIIWTAAYNEATEANHNPLEAIRIADSAVKLTQGSGAPEDISKFESGSPFVRMFTMFYGYFNMQSNLLGTEFNKTIRELGLKKGAGRLLYVYVMGFMIPAAFSEVIVKAMAGQTDDDDDGEYLDDYLSMFFLSQLRTATAMVPGVGPAAQAGINAFNEKWYDDRISTSPAVAMIESAVSAPKSVYGAIAGDGSKKKAARDLLTMLGMMTGVPLAPLSRPVGYLSDVAEGAATPTGPVDFARGLVTGKPGRN